MTADQQPRTAAQQRFHEANERHYSNREVEMAAGAFDRAEEVSQELEEWTHLVHMRLNTFSSGLAALRDTVDELSSKFSNANDVIDRRLTALESPASAPESTRTPECIDQFITILDEWLESETVPNRIEAFTKYRELARQELASKAAAPEPDPLCQCGHSETDHYGKTGRCHFVHSKFWQTGGSMSGCACERFVPQAAPATAHQEPPDAVLVAIQTLYVMIDHDIIHPLMTYLREEWKSLTGDDERTVYEVHAAIRAYGRGGAR